MAWQVRAGEPLVGRDREVATVAAFLDGAQDRTPPAAAGLLLLGEPGIGKSALWGRTVAEAAGRGWTVLATRAAQAETGLSFTGLMDLLEDVAGTVLPELPEPLATALEVALLRRSPTGHPPGQREVSLALLAVLRQLAAVGPVLIAVDDVQWLDPASAQVLAFALRRLPTEPVRLVVSCRLDTALDPVLTPPVSGLTSAAGLVLGALEPAAVTTLTLGPLEPAALGRLLAERLGLRLAARAVLALHERTGGNPYWALEAIRAVDRQDPDDLVVAAELPVATGLGALVAGRVRELTPAARLVLVVAAALAQPVGPLVRGCVAALARAHFDPAVPPGLDPAAALAEATTAGVVVTAADRIRPAHPLLGFAALGMLRADRRRLLHDRLAHQLTDPEERGRHLARSTGGVPDAAVAAALDAAVDAARSRGAIWAAAELASTAVRLTPPSDVDDRAGRQVTTAELLVAAGELAAARGPAGEGLAAARDGPVRARAALALSLVAYWTEGSGPAARYAERALADAGDDPVLLARAHVLLADLADRGVASCQRHARLALALLDGLGPDREPAVRTAAELSLLGAAVEAGEGLDPLWLEGLRAVQDAGPLPAVLDRVGTARGYLLKVVDDLAGSRQALTGMIAAARREGDEAALSNLYGHLALTELWAGRFPAAGEAVEAGRAVAAATGIASDALLAAGGLAALHGGADFDPTPHRQRIEECHRTGFERGAMHQYAVLGTEALLAGRPAAAVEALGRAWRTARAIGIREPGRRLRLDLDLAEALVAAGDPDAARTLAADLHALADSTGRPGPLALALHVDGLVAAAAGDLTGAAELLTRVLGLATPYPVERARALLALGRTLRRARARRRAADRLAEAERLFTAAGAAGWARRAAEELRRTSARPARGEPGDGLTDTERRVAELVAAGRSNREVASELVVSVRTVEGHLAAVYRKLQVSGRTALAARTGGFSDPTADRFG